jgi:F0F1-type ATP synthase assembly protein I
MNARPACSRTCNSMERKMDTMNERENPDLQQMRALSAELMAETARISREPIWRPFAIALGLIGVGTAVGVGWIVLLSKILA